MKQMLKDASQDESGIQLRKFVLMVQDATASEQGIIQKLYAKMFSGTIDNT